MELKRISNKTVSKITASVCVSSYKKVIEELVYNSLDADSTSIAIRVFIQDSFIQILDNGNGISKDNLKLIGHWYVSSKSQANFSTKPKFGYRGLALASTIEISQEVKIISRGNNSEDTYVKTFLNSKERDIFKTNVRPSRGTTVEIKGFLYNLHIQRHSINPFLEMESIKTFLEHLSLVCCNVSFSLRDDSRNELILKIHKNRDVYQTLQSVFNITKEDLQELQVEKNQYKIQGFFQKSDNNIHSYHLIYVNGRFITQSKIHKIVNKHFNDQTGRKNLPKTKKNYSRKGSDFLNNRTGFYLLFITCPSNDFDIIYAPEKTTIEFKKWMEIEKLIEKLLKFHHGDLRVKLLTKKDSIKTQYNDIDTRKHVTNIMQKILGNHWKNPRVSQIPNGIKGNCIKRKRKKKTQDKKIKKACHYSDKIEATNSAVNYNSGLNIHQLKSIQKDTKVLRKSTKFNSRHNVAQKDKTALGKSNKKCIEQGKQENNFSFSHNTIIKKFKDPTNSVKNRCALLFNNVQKSLGQYQTVHKVLGKESDEFTLNGSTRQNDFINQGIPNIVPQNVTESRNIKDVSNVCEEKINFKTSYDLINPIHVSQQQLKTHSDEEVSLHQQEKSSMSPVTVTNFIENNDESHGEEYYDDLIYRNFARDIQIYSEVLEPGVPNIKNFSTREIEKVSCKINKANTDWIFDANSLCSAKVVLGQVDSKFIAAMVSGKSAKHNKSCEFLVLFDQHAVDERIRLENNLSDYTDGHQWKSTPLDPMITKLPKDNILYLHNHKEKFARFGLQWTIRDGNILFCSIPKAIIGQNPRHTEVIVKAVKCLISEQIESIKSLKGNISLYPKSIMDLVFSEACRYAIKFGDRLSKDECRDMLSSLAKCKVPFQCAHGRPVMAVMMEIPQSNHQYKVNRNAILRFMSLK